MLISVCARYSRNKDEGDEGGVGVQVHRAQGGGDLGCGGDCREGPAICLGPGRCDPASLFGPTEHTGVTGRDIPPDWGIVSEF